MPETQGQKNQTTMRYRAPVKQDEHLDDLKRVTEGMIASNLLKRVIERRGTIVRGKGSAYSTVISSPSSTVRPQ